MSEIDDADRPEGGGGPGAGGPGDAVDRYLDEMFDHLAGTGAAGRRLLAETEDHLRTAVGAETARGVPVARAEREAVARFGPPEVVARQVRRAARARAAGALVSGGWLLAGLVLLLLAATYLAKVVELATLLRLHPPAAPSCLAGGHLPPAGAGACTSSASDLRSNATAGLVLLLVGAVALLARRLVARRAGLGRSPRRFPLAAAACFGLLCVGFALFPATPYATGLPLGLDRGLFGVPMGMGIYPHLIVAAGSLLAALSALTWHLAVTRRLARAATR
ncbi:permease prefix domain 1-containing protein [Micromonospora sp. NPDC049559]|uniref:permease prefix domain 1-containing protein n=1 Tax=Micromonospora sp. NPDC049559 TaxID=3155923 RepID=UPI00344122DE